MKQILVYGDSLSWGIIPDTRQRFSFDKRWPGVMEQVLLEKGFNIRVFEDCLNGRRTVYQDPFKPGRRALDSVSQSIESHSPLALVILFLGTNDLQSTDQFNAWHASEGMAALVHAVRAAPLEPGMPLPEVLIVAPPRIKHPQGVIGARFSGAEERSCGISERYRLVADQHGCHFFATDDVTPVSRVDGIHLDEYQHKVLGEALAHRTEAILFETRAEHRAM
ncbi:SGNH/GDSL hydrolase family protein [Marinobacterium jannaschii]|uniref:SGNH/GDSL hydrolase family protein n=1 Tax=Marinobacterium jannaschii TaxID=64970 RepID=UPI00056D55C8|nr:SGNH/GDSL hydrolase family protein [Marinobacterium jannaschii]